MKHSFATLPLLALALLLGACAGPRALVPASTTYSTQPSTAARGDHFSGQWAGTWQSEATHHHGRLLCRFDRLDARHYQANFTAHWGPFHGRYQVVFQTHSEGRQLFFQGEHDLGKLFGGLYHYEGHATATVFEAHYRSSAKDYGTFQMTRSET